MNPKLEQAVFFQSVFHCCNIDFDQAHMGLKAVTLFKKSSQVKFIG